jgi:hypothetical protein
MSHEAVPAVIGSSHPRLVISNIECGWECDKEEEGEEGEQHEEAGTLQSDLGQQSGGSQAVSSGKLSGLDITQSEAENLVQEMSKGVPCNVNANAFFETGEVLAVTGGRSQEIEKQRDISIKSKVERYTKTVVFREIKFLADQEELGSLREKGSIGNIIMDYMSIEIQSERYSWWVLYQDVVKKALDQQRSNCNIAMKETVVGKTSGALLQG